MTEIPALSVEQVENAARRVGAMDPTDSFWRDFAAEIIEQINANTELSGHALVEVLQGLDTPERVRFYEHDFYVLSNFSAFNLEWEGLTFQTSEAAYHWEKFASEEMDQPGGRSDIAHCVWTAPSAHEAFKIAERNKSKRRADWDAVKVDIMRNILRAKAEQHEYVRRKLLATGERELVEDSWRDDYWGWGPNRDGQNMLGKLWMEVRAEIRGSK